MSIIESELPSPQEQISQESAISQVRADLLSEIDQIIGIAKIQERNKRIKEEDIVDHYIKYLKKIEDPRYNYISELFGDVVDSDIIDNELDHFLDLSRRFSELSHIEEHGGTVAHIFDDLDFGTQNALSNAVKQYDAQEVLVLLSQFERPVLERILLSAVGVNVILMIGHNLESTHELTESFYNMIALGNLSGKSIVSLGVVLPFLYEAILKIRAQGGKNYIKNNTLDAGLNIAGIGEMGLMVEEAFGIIANHTALGSLLRSLRVLRILRVTQKNQVVKEISHSLGESLPSMMKIAVTFWGFSILSTLFFMEVYRDHMEEFSNLSNAFDSMTRLFFNDDAIGLNFAMREAEGVHPITTEVSIWLSRTYQFISNIFMIGIPPAIVYDVIAKNTTTKRYLASILETLGSIKESIEGLRKDIKDTRKVTLSGLTKLKNSLSGKEES